MRSYRSLVAWQKARLVAAGVLRLSPLSKRPNAWALLDQLRRAAISVEANIVEGYALGTPGLFRRHLRIAFGSAAEVECLLELGEEVGLIEGADGALIREDLNELMAVLRGLLRSRNTIGP